MKMQKKRVSIQKESIKNNNFKLVVIGVIMGLYHPMALPIPSISCCVS